MNTNTASPQLAVQMLPGHGVRLSLVTPLAVVAIDMDADLAAFMGDALQRRRFLRHGDLPVSENGDVVIAANGSVEIVANGLQETCGPLADKGADLRVLVSLVDRQVEQHFVVSPERLYFEGFDEPHLGPPRRLAFVSAEAWLNGPTGDLRGEQSAGIGEGVGGTAAERSVGLVIGGDELSGHLDTVAYGKSPLTPASDRELLIDDAKAASPAARGHEGLGRGEVETAPGFEANRHGSAPDGS